MRSTTKLASTIALLSTLSVTPATGAQAPVPGAYIQEPSEDAQTCFVEALQIPTITYDDPSQTDWTRFDQFKSHLERCFPALHAVAEDERFHRSAWLYTWPGSNPDLDPVMFIAHQDVVPIEEATLSDWTYPPFEARIADGYVWGRGTLDMKGQLIAMMSALNTLAAEGFAPERTILIGLGDDEEVGGQGARAIAAALRARNINPHLILDEGLMVLEPLSLTGKPAAMIGVAEKGYGTLQITAEGVAGHSSRPPEQTAVGQLARALLALEEVKFQTNLDPLTRETLAGIANDFEGLSGLAINNLWLFSPMIQGELMSSATGRALLTTTLAPTVLQGSPKENALPQYVQAQINVRIHPRDTPEAILAEVQNQLAPIEGISVEWSGTPSPAPTPSMYEGQTYETLQRHIVGLHENEISQAPTLVIGATDARAYTGLSENIYRFQPVVIPEDEAARMHGVNERLSLSNFGRMIAFYEGLVRDLSTSD